MRKLKGSITVFLVCMLASIIMIYTFLLDFINYKHAILIAEADRANAVNYMGMYWDDSYREDIGFSVFKNYELERLSEIINKHRTMSKTKGYSTSYIDHLYLRNRTGDYTQIQNIMSNNLQYHVSEAEINSVERSFYELINAETTVNEALPDLAISYDSEKIKNAEYVDGMYNLFLNTLAASYKGGMSNISFIRFKRCPLYGDKVDNIWTWEDTLPSNTSNPLSTDICETVDANKEMVNEGPYYYTSNYRVYTSTPEQFSSITNLIYYMDEHMKNASEKACGKSHMYGEYEYILYGHQTDLENISRACEQIMRRRFMADYYSLYKSGLNLSESDKINWALNEAYYDTISLLNGGLVEPIKAYKSFATAKDTKFSDIKAGTAKSGVSYLDYLHFLTIYANKCEEMVGITLMYEHTFNWIELTIGEDPALLCTEIDITYKAYSRIKPVSPLGYVLNKKEPEEKLVIIGVNGF